MQKILIVIPTLNEAAHIDSLVRAMIRRKPNADALIIVADGGSSDGTRRVVKGLSAEFDCVNLLHNPHRRQSAGINLAVERYGAGAHVLVRCDAHCDYPEDYVSRLLLALENSEADSVVVPMDSIGHTCLQKAIAWLSDSKIGSGGSAHRGGKKSGFVDHGHHAAMYLDAFRRAGGYDETYAHNEDAEFDCRLRAVGGRIFLDSDIRISYRPRSNLLDLWRQYFNYGRGRSRTVRKHPRSLRLRQFLVPANLAATLVTLLLSTIEPILLVWPAAYLAALSTYAITLAVKHRSACGMLALPAAAVMHFAWAIGFFWGLLSVRETPWQRRVLAS